MPRLLAKPIVDLKAAGVRGEVIDFSVDIDGTICVLVADRMPEYRRRSDGGRLFHSFGIRTNHYRVYLIRDRTATCIEIEPTRENFTDARCFGPGEVLLVRGRTRLGEPGNGIVIDLSGKTRRRIHLGDGVQHLFVTPNKTVWIAYIDEAYMQPASHGGGIVQLDRRGRVLFNLNKTGKADCEDCYAMTMNRHGTVHACCFADFPVYRITLDGKLRTSSKSGQAGSQFLAVRGDNALTSGGYGYCHQVFMRSLSKGRRRRCHVILDGQKLHMPADVFSFDGVLYVLVERQILAIDVPGASRRRGSRRDR